jgi:hypothetical protein
MIPDLQIWYQGHHGHAIAGEEEEDDEHEEHVPEEFACAQHFTLLHNYISMHVE